MGILILFQIKEVAAGLRPGGWILINAPGKPANPEAYLGFNPAGVAATGIAIKNDMGTCSHPIINTAMTGALARILGMLPLEAIVEAIREDIPIKSEQNIQAA
jgi:pyruvate ferredoxin oxidoreductase gamma subunit/2-oxoisovalerate ferredoxin oxidoreductase gamma subunit